MSSDINTVISTDWQLSNAAPDALVEAINDITQCIANIINTQLGTDPLRPDFGCNFREHIDEPITEAPQLLVNAIIDAIEKWEDRVVIEAVNYKIEGSQVIYQISWNSIYGSGVNLIPLSS